MRTRLVTTVVALLTCMLLPAPASNAAGQGDEVIAIPSPDGRWTALLNQNKGSVGLLRASDGRATGLFPPGSSAYDVSWSPDSQRLLVVRTNWTQNADGTMESGGPIQIWQAEFPLSVQPDDRSLCPDFAAPRGKRMAFCLYQSPAPADEYPEQLVLGRWSPDSRQIVFWRGILSASVATDGLPAYVMDVADGHTAELADLALLNLHYHSWAPDSSALVMTAGGDRSTLIGKRMIRYEITSQQTTALIGPDDQIPGQVAWSPDAQWIAYAAVYANQVDQSTVHQVTWDNPGVAGRRLYLLSSDSGTFVRLNGNETFQDSPLWSDDAGTLYYVERQGDELALMAFDMSTAQTQIVPGARQSLPDLAESFGQLDADDLLAHRPVESAPTATVAPAPGCG